MLVGPLVETGKVPEQVLPQEDQGQNAIDSVQILTVEIEIEGRRNIVVMCIYRTPASNVETFKDNLEELMRRLNDKSKTCIICGDTNINLINVLKHKATSAY